MGNVGILAYGSLISDPGFEIGPLIVQRVTTTTPFPVEFARFSRTRGGAPTVVPHSSGKPVAAEVLVFPDSISLEEGRNLLWRRETRHEGSDKPYRESSRPDAVLVRDSVGFCGVGHVLYTDFNPGGKLENPDPHLLAQAAIQSVKQAKPNEDGISYLMSLIEAGVETTLSPRYVAEILVLTRAGTLAEALDFLRSEN